MLGFNAITSTPVAEYNFAFLLGSNEEFLTVNLNANLDHDSQVRSRLSEQVQLNANVAENVLTGTSSFILENIDLRSNLSSNVINSTLVINEVNLDITVHDTFESVRVINSSINLNSCHKLNSSFSEVRIPRSHILTILA